MIKNLFFRKKDILGLSLGLFLAGTSTHSQANVLIEGFAEWQAGRVEQIILDQAVFGAIENKYVQTFFPKTTGAVKSYSGSTSAQRLIPIIQTMINSDLDDIERVFTECTKGYLVNVSELFRDQKVQEAMDALEAFERALNKDNDNIQQDTINADYSFYSGNPISDNKEVRGLITWYTNYVSTVCGNEQDKPEMSQL